MRTLTEYAPVRGDSRGEVRGVAPSLPAEGEVHLWVLPGVVDPPRRAAYAEVLSTSERTRARAFRYREDADRFVAAHGGLRHLLSSYTGLGASDLEFAPGSGKPALGTPRARAEIRFNMSHSGSVVVVAVAAGREVGVDVERIGLPIDIGEIARRCFCEAERTLLAGCAAYGMEEMFYTIWTRKEAYVKAVGGGMALDLTAVDVSSAPALIERRWHLCDVSILPEGYRGALAADGTVTRVRVFDRYGDGGQC
jgi:4'-phosphopantetheinyl transferase